MGTITIDEILKITGGQLLHGSDAIPFEGYTTDSRSVQHNVFYIPIVGEHFDGNDFIADAFQKGASWSFVSDLSKIPLEENLDHKGLIFVGDTVAALQQMATYVLKKSGIPVIGVTGSTGKTSTKEFIASVLQTQYQVLKNEGNFNNHIGLPLTCLKLCDTHEIAVLEMGMDKLGEIETLAGITNPDCAVITNIGLSHIENIGSQQGILQAKLEITKFMSAKNTLFINGNDTFLDTVSSDTYAVVKVGTGTEQDCQISGKVLHGLEGAEFQITWDSAMIQELRCTLTVPGEHSIQNAALAAAVGLHYGISPEQVVKGLQTARNTGMRMNVAEAPNGVVIINDAYNASPDSVIAAMKVLSSETRGKRIAVLSDMLELGQESETGHRQAGVVAAELKLDGLYLVGDRSRWTASGALEAGMDAGKVAHFSTKQELVHALKAVVCPGDTVLVKGSRGMKMEQVVALLQEAQL